MFGEWAQVEVVELVNDGSGLAFGIVGGRSSGVVVKSVLPGGVADRVSTFYYTHTSSFCHEINRMMVTFLYARCACLPFTVLRRVEFFTLRVEFNFSSRSLTLAA